MLAEYGDPEWLDALAQQRLAMAWIRRKRFEAQLIAVEVGRLFASGEERERRVPAHELLAMAGIEL